MRLGIAQFIAFTLGGSIQLLIGNKKNVGQSKIHTTDYVFTFDRIAFVKLDDFALLACQKYNLGNDTDWFGSFRGGLYGFYSRIYGIAEHYRLVHSWIPRLRHPSETEYHVTSTLFNMDSAFECLTYALNALGYAYLFKSFRDVTSKKALSRICPSDILGKPSDNPPESPLEGYSVIFPETQKCCLENHSLLKTIFDLHDVSKHRETIYLGGMARSDPPDGFYESVGAITTNEKARFWPSAEILLPIDPKAPKIDRTQAEIHEYPKLEDIANEFMGLIQQLGNYALADCEANINLPHKKLLQDT